MIELILIALFVIPKLFGINIYAVSSSSMVPKYPVGSLIYVDKINENDEIKVGDSITFYMKNSKIIATHEVYEVDYENQTYYTQGINNLDSKGNIIHDVNPVLRQNIIGKPIFCIPYLGYINKVITKSPGAYILIIFTTILIVVSYLLDERKEKKK